MAVENNPTLEPYPTKALGLKNDHHEALKGTPLRKRLPFLPQLTAITLTASAILSSATPTSLDAPKNPQLQTEPQNQNIEEENIPEIEPIQVPTLSEIFERRKEMELLTQPQKEEENKKYEKILEEYRKTPTSIRDILTKAWEDLGLSKTDAQNLIENSFQDKSLLKTHLDKKVKLLYADEDIFNAPTLKGLQNYFLSLNHKEGLKTIIKAFNEHMGAQIPPIDLNNPSQETLQKSWEYIENFSKENSQSMEFLQKTKQEIDAMLKEKFSGAGGLAHVEDNVFFLSKKTSPKNNFLYLATHEALHNGQEKSPPLPLIETLKKIQKQSQEKLYQKKTQNPNIAALLAKHPTREAPLRLKSAEETDYLLSPKEIAAWTGMIKKVYYQDTKELLNKKSESKDFEKFQTWLQNAKFPSSSFEDHILKTFRTLNELMDQTPKTQKILQDHLKDIAQKTPKRNLEQPDQLGIA
jgi:hypothetical protein